MSQVRHVRLPEITVEGKRLGRHVFHDERSHDFRAETADPSELKSVKHNAKGLPLDQGNIGSCTAEATCGACNSDPNQAKAKKVYVQNDAYKLYQREAKEEGYDVPPDDPGGTGLAVCKAAKEIGMISSYTHAFGIQDALLALVKRPVITGVSWYSSFDKPDSSGLVKITKSAIVRGGHEFVVDEMEVPDGATIDDLDDIILVPWNSWGLAYGVGGKFRMTAATWHELLTEQGDVTVPIVA